MTLMADKQRTKRFNPGSSLQQARRRTHLTRQDVAARLKVDVADIKHIDLWQIGKLPPNIRLRSTLRAYAKLLRLDPIPFEQSVAADKSKNYKAGRLWVLSRTTTVMATSIIVILATGFIVWKAFVATALPHLEVLYPPEDYKTVSRSITLKGRTSEGAQIFINGIDVLVEPDGSFASLVILQSGINKIDISAINSYGRSSRLSRTVLSTKAE